VQQVDPGLPHQPPAAALTAHRWITTKSHMPPT
jgi:hypothetical protein